MASKKNMKNQPPPKVRPKAGTSGKTGTQKLDLGKECLAAQAQSPVGSQIATEAAALKAARDAVIARGEELTNLRAELDKKQLELRTAESDLDTAIENYAHEAANIAKDDPSVLLGLGVEAAATQRAPRAEGPAEMPSNVRVLLGEDSGTVIVKWTRPIGAGAFLAQYKLEPQAAGAPPSDWSPAEGFATKKVEWAIDNLPPAAHVRVRVRSIGAEVGPWSEEVLGRAR